MNLFVTGGTGFIGSHFVGQALAAGHKVTAIRRPSMSPRIALAKEPNWLDLSLDAVRESHLQGSQVVIHLAAAGVSPDTANWSDCFRVNLTESLSLWQRAAEAGVGRFIICGSCFEYGRSGERYEYIPTDAPLEPTGPYHSSKAAATMAALGLAVQKNLQMTIFRPFHVFGPGEAEKRLWPSLRRAAQRGEDFPMTAGAQVRDFIDVQEVAAVFLRSLESEPSPGCPKILNVGSGLPQTLLEFSQRWWERFNATGRLLPGAVAYRTNEVMRYVPKL